MKRISMMLIGFVAAIVFIGIISWKNNDDQNNLNKQVGIATGQHHPDSRPIIAMRKIKLKAGVSAEAFENFAVKVASGEYGSLPGAKFYYAKGERGDETGSYISFIEFDSKATRDFYAPVADDNTKTPPEVRKMIDAFFGKLNPEAGKLVEAAGSGKKGYTDYIVLK